MCVEQLSSIGVDMEFSLASMMDLPIQQVIEETRDQMVEGIRYRAQVTGAEEHSCHQEFEHFVFQCSIRLRG